MIDRAKKALGYRGSETHGCNVWIYGHGVDPIFADIANAQPLHGPGNYLARSIDTFQPAIIRASCSSQIGGPGSFSVTIKVPQSQERSWLYQFPDDSWIDLEFTTNGTPYHVFRGLTVSQSRNVRVKNGATVTEFTISGQGMQRVFSNTRIAFNNFSGENIVGGALLRSGLAVEGFFGARRPSDVTKAFLFGTLEALGEYGRALWPAPAGVPGVAPDTPVTAWCDFLPASDADLPAREAINPNWVLPDGANAWSLAQEWIDPDFNELFVDLVDRSGAPLEPETSYERRNTRIAVILRRRPFPDSVDGAIGQSPWASLPEIRISRQDIASGRTDHLSGDSRINWVEVATQLTQETLGRSPEIQRPLVDVASTEYHGARRQLVSSRYTSQIDSFLPDLRARYYQWHALNPYFRTGSIPLTAGRPDARIGMKYHILPEQAGQESEIGYIEGVNHRFEAGLGPASLLTQLIVTRGWLGDEKSLYSAVKSSFNAAREIEGPT